MSELRSEMGPSGPENSKEEKFTNFTAETEQMTTRGDGTLELKDKFNQEEIDFGTALDHVKIHQEGDVAGSQFNGELIDNPQDLEMLLKKILPKELQYDQFDRVELTLDVSHDQEKPIGWTGVKSIEEIKEAHPEAEIEKKIRIPGGQEDVEEGVEGAWYPQKVRNPETKKMEILRDENGEIANPKSRFEPKANIATVDQNTFEEIAGTNKITVVMEKRRDTGKPTLLTTFPGENAPMFPAKIETKTRKTNQLKNSNEADFWNNHAFIKTK